MSERLTIVESADYLLGRKYLDTLKREPFRGDLDFLQYAREEIKKHPMAEQNLKLADSDAIFYKLEPDLAHEIPKHQREEFFYALKLGYLSPVVPAKALFYIQKCKETYNTFNALPKFVPAQMLKQMFSEGYCKDGVSLRDVICSQHDPNYLPITEGQMASRNGDYWDIYIAESDTIAIVPEKIKEKLTPEDIRRLKVENNQITLAGTPLFILGGFIGASNSIYDLRYIV